MKRIVLMLAMAVLVVGSTRSGAWAQVTKTETATVTCNPNLSTNPCTANVVVGKCPGVGYDSICPSGSCGCLTFNNAKVSGSLAGAGTANGNITLDAGLIVPPLATFPVGCVPFFGVINLATTIPAAPGTLAGVPLTMTLDINGSACHHFPSGNQNITSGGFGIASASNSATGWGTLTGTQNKSSSTVNPNVAVYHLKGTITTP